jgi:1-acyl-sn-glycerol-3-phosphate acyltransferase
LKIARFIYAIYVLIVFILTMFLILPFVVIASFFGRIKGGNAIYSLCTLWADLWFFFIGIHHKNYYESPHDKHKPYIFVANHISYIDAPIICKTLRQRLRILAKYETSKIPFFGFIYRNAVVTVDRSSTEARSKSVRILKSVLKKEISIFIFPEGTFNETGAPLKSFFDGAFRVAIEMQTPIKPVLFLDGYDRMNYKSALLVSPGRSRAVFLEEIPTAGLNSRDLNYLKEKVFTVMEQKLIHYKASWIKAENLLQEG